MRTTDGKGVLDVRTWGPPDLVDMLHAALAHVDRAERWTHGFHTYPAGLHPDAARDILHTFAPQHVLDPFCGGGTVLVESMAAGAQAVGSDIGPVARLVARTRTALCTADDLTALRSASRKMTAAAKDGQGELPPAGVLDEVGDWYAPHVLRELAALRRGLDGAPPAVRGLLTCAWSSILVKVSWRRSDTSARREEHHRPPGTTSILFHKKCRELARRLEAFADVARSAPRAKVLDWDARTLGPMAPVDLVLTSPPYPAVYDYLPMQSLREAWLGAHGDRGEEIGARRHWRHDPEGGLRRWQRDTEAWMTRVDSVLAPGGHVVVVIGDGLTPDGAVDSMGPTKASAENAGWRLEAAVSAARPDHARAGRRWEHALVFHRAAAPG